ncbi:MAG: HAMP domain-containing sensor histidine kinase [Brevundimonas sp.]|uniref:HAMP domain-containing sensor histidine kinase n=1 Tax=Brevundimonas sp. TaxID=1871086 RepID=UPI002735B734|nr:HAMP domain-containing sensor histidine kinase [Brevundimonas sp.]MDP3656861.1 HAMP domain-containing sensor histidine kinase [Brevundimonas sp.]MDZ4112288.1 HAMP domain-containing sensor histidine kinase [Brevundimonas sp.]
MAFRFLGPRAWLGRRTSTQLAAGIAVMAALALTGSLMATGAAVRMDQREKAALAALDDYGAMVGKLGAESSLTAADITAADAAYLSAWLSAFQDGPARDAGTIEETCSTGRGGAGVRFIRAPVGKPAGLAALETTRGVRVPRLGDGVHVVRLDRGVLCPSRAVEVVVVRRAVGALDIAVGRVVDLSGDALGWAVAAVAAAAGLLLVFGLTAATFARRRLTGAVAEVSRALDRASVGDFSIRAPETALAPELTELTGQVNLTLDRLEELLSWLRDSADQLAHDFRTPLARASARLDRLKEAASTPEARALATEARADLTRLTRAMNEAMALRDGEAWVFETVRLDRLAASAAELYQPLAEERGVVIRVEAAPVPVLGVRSLLQRAVTNLVDNAVKFSPEGGAVELRVRLEDGRPVLSVADQGPGLDPDILDDPARAVSSAADEGRESHGMGLAYVRAILKRHGASMAIDDAAPGAVVTARFSR